MTFEELKAEAKAQGYRLLPCKNYKEKLLPCTCGCNRRDHRFGWDGDKGQHKVILECQKCGKKASGTSEVNAIHNWNEMIKAETMI